MTYFESGYSIRIKLVKSSKSLQRYQPYSNNKRNDNTRQFNGGREDRCKYGGDENKHGEEFEGRVHCVTIKEYEFARFGRKIGYGVEWRMENICPALANLLVSAGEAWMCSPTGEVVVNTVASGSWLVESLAAKSWPQILSPVSQSNLALHGRSCKMSWTGANRQS